MTAEQEQHTFGNTPTVEELIKALAVIYNAADKARDNGEEWWWIDNHTNVQAYICSVLGAPPIGTEDYEIY
jgi:hypothetical protein